MALNSAFVKNGATIEVKSAPAPIGPLKPTIFAMVGTAPERDPSIQLNTPYRVDSLAALAKLDINQNELGTLWRSIAEIYKHVTVVVYVVVVDEGATPTDTVNNVLGSVDPATGMFSGVQQLADLPEQATHIAAPGFSDVPVLDALALMAQKTYSIAVIDGPNTNNSDAHDFSNSVNAESGYDRAYVVDSFVSVYSQVAKSLVLMSAVPLALACFGRATAVESPAATGGVTIKGTARPIAYNFFSKDGPGQLLLKHGVSFFARADAGGYSLIGNRSVTGRFINKVSLDNQLTRIVGEQAKTVSGKNLTLNLMESFIKKLNKWMDKSASNDEMIGANVSLHPTLNNVDTYQNGEWFIVINYAGYSPNEHLVVHFNEDLDIVESFIEGAI